MMTGNHFTAVLDFQKIPVLPSVADLVIANVIPGGTMNNLGAVEADVLFSDDLPDFARIILADAQTSGGLLIAIPRGEAGALLNDLHQSGVMDAAVIGEIAEWKGKAIRVDQGQS
ncbi:MAG: hypothetical protein ACM3N9_00110, partial [Syntrophothermus sp.]